MKRFFVAVSLIGTLTMPMAAMAKCNQMVGSYAVTCERGVQVYRHQALSSLPAVSQSEVTKRKAIAQQGRQMAVAQQLKARQVTIAEKAQTAQANDLIYTRRGYNRRSTTSRRYVSYGGRGLTRNHFRRARLKH